MAYRRRRTMVNPPSYPEILAAAREVVAGLTGMIESWDVVNVLADQLGQPRRNARDDGTFGGQVRRAMNTLADEGLLVKVGRGQRHPSGQYADRLAWYPPAAWAAAVTDAEEKRAANEALTDRWFAVHKALATAGFPPRDDVSGAAPVLKLEDWERLIGRLR